MNKLIIISILVAIGWQGYGKHQGPRGTAAGTRSAADSAGPRTAIAETIASAQFKCDGRTYCTQMTSCQEATFFLKNCPGLRIDGDNDGIPCATQWCK